MSTELFILNEAGQPVPEPNLLVWGRWFESKARIVKQENVEPYRVSTVFLGLNHNFDPGGPPILWETMVFGRGPLNQTMDRCSGNREQAEAMHLRMIERISVLARTGTDREHGGGLHGLGPSPTDLARRPDRIEAVPDCLPADDPARLAGESIIGAVRRRPAGAEEA